MNTTHLKQVFFFDLPLSDVYGCGAAALNVIYHGTRRGEFYHATSDHPMDLNKIEAFLIALVPRTVRQLSSKHDYNLVYYRKDIADRLWKRKKCDDRAELKKLVRRVKCDDHQSLQPNRLRTFFVKSNHPIYLAEFDCGVPNDDTVPHSYLKAFQKRFTGFILRSPHGYSLADTLFADQGLCFLERRDATDISWTSPHVTSYAQRQSQRISA